MVEVNGSVVEIVSISGSGRSLGNKEIELIFFNTKESEYVPFELKTSASNEESDRLISGLSLLKNT